MSILNLAVESRCIIYYITNIEHAQRAVEAVLYEYVEFPRAVPEIKIDNGVCTRLARNRNCALLVTITMTYVHKLVAIMKDKICHHRNFP